MLSECKYPWEALQKINRTIMGIGQRLSREFYDNPADNIWISKNARISPTSVIIGPCIIGDGTEVRPGAYIRGNVIIGDCAVVGNSTELKNCILFDGAQVPHYNYVGDSILGHRAHMGAGAITSNVKGNKCDIVVHGNCEYETGLRKFGAMLGDYTEIGCGSVLNPGTIIGRNTQVYPLCSVRGIVPENSIYKSEHMIVDKTIN